MNMNVDNWRGIWMSIYMYVDNSKGILMIMCVGSSRGICIWMRM